MPSQYDRLRDPLRFAAELLAFSEQNGFVRFATHLRQSIPDFPLECVDRVIE
jgi:hypothetical protein